MNHLQLFDVNFMYIIIVQLGDIINNALKYCWFVLDLMWPKVTLKLVFIVKCMGVKYTLCKTLYN